MTLVETLVGGLILTIVICAVLVTTFLSTELKKKNKEIEKLQELITDFINRAQSGDLPTYLSLKFNTDNPTPVAGFPENVSRDDLTEYARLQGQTQGLGQEIYDDDPELESTLAELGIDVSFIEHS